MVLIYIQVMKIKSPMKDQACHKEVRAWEHYIRLSNQSPYISAHYLQGRNGSPSHQCPSASTLPLGKGIRTKAKGSGVTSMNLSR